MSKIVRKSCFTDYLKRKMSLPKVAVIFLLCLIRARIRYEAEEDHFLAQPDDLLDLLDDDPLDDDLLEHQILLLLLPLP